MGKPQAGWSAPHYIQDKLAEGGKDSTKYHMPLSKWYFELNELLSQFFKSVINLIKMRYY